MCIKTWQVDVKLEHLCSQRRSPGTVKLRDGLLTALVD